MIADFSKRTGVAVSEARMWNVRTQHHESPRSLVERVCNFLERYPLSRSGTEEIGPRHTRSSSDNHRSR
jgi:hypothetical protein